MKRSLLLCLSVLAAASCAPQESSPPTTTASPGDPAAPPGGVTTFYDGSYYGSFAQNVSAPGSQCPNYTVAPALSINNGVARFAALDIDFQGSVTPQGQLSMRAPAGQTFDGQIDLHYVLKGRVTGNCVYDATWQRKGGAGPKAGT